MAKKIVTAPIRIQEPVVKLSTRLPPDLAHKLRVRAATDDLSIRDAVVAALRAYVGK